MRATCSTDLVRDFVISLHADDGLRLSQRKLVNLLRASRPIDAASQSAEWSVTNESPLGVYVSTYSINHIEAGWDHTEEHASNCWLEDYPQDVIVKAASQYLKFEKCSELALQAQSAGDSFKFAKLTAAAGVCARTIDRAALERSRELERLAVDALGALPDINPEIKDHCERLEMEMVNQLLTAFDPGDFKYLPREWRLTTTVRMSRPT
eukprot:COSAG02_NODE_6656_length_3433_cov_147.826035_2_plen_209_part_00